MKQTDDELMAEYGITSETKTIYLYQQHKYERLKDAVTFAEIEARRASSGESAARKK